MAMSGDHRVRALTLQYRGGESGARCGLAGGDRAAGTPRDRRERAALEEDLRSIPLVRQRIALRLRNFLPLADAYLAATRGPMAYMLRLREIELQTAQHEDRLSGTWRALAKVSGEDDAGFARAWEAAASDWSFRQINDLIERHNRWYPIEARLAMDPKTGGYALVNGRDYRLEPLDAAWVLERFPPVLPSS